MAHRLTKFHLRSFSPGEKLKFQMFGFVEREYKTVTFVL